MNPEFKALSIKNQEKLKTKYSQINYDLAVSVPVNTNILIDDVGLDGNDRQHLSGLINTKIVLLNPQDLMNKTEASIETSTQNGALLLIPREGGLKIATRLKKQPVATEVLVTRDPSNPIDGRLIDDPSSQELLDTFQTLKPESVLIADDVAVSGATAEYLRRFVESKLGTTYLWSLTVWLMAFPRDKKSQSGIEGFSQSNASLLYAGESGRTPVNTLYDWIFNPVKKPAVVPAYAQKYAANSSEFQAFIDELSAKYQDSKNN